MSSCQQTDSVAPGRPGASPPPPAPPPGPPPPAPATGGKCGVGETACYSTPGCGYCVSEASDGDCLPGDMTGAFTPAAHDCKREYSWYHAGVYRTDQSMCDTVFLLKPSTALSLPCHCLSLALHGIFTAFRCVIAVGEDDVRCYQDCTYGLPNQVAGGGRESPPRARPPLCRVIVLEDDCTRMFLQNLGESVSFRSNTMICCNRRRPSSSRRRRATSMTAHTSRSRRRPSCGNKCTSAATC